MQVCVHVTRTGLLRSFEESQGSIHTETHIYIGKTPIIEISQMSYPLICFLYCSLRMKDDQHRDDHELIFVPT